MSEILLNSGDGMKLFKEICRNPKNFDRYFILADYCEEQGDSVAAECWRLLGETKKYPIKKSPVLPLYRCSYWWYPPGTRLIPKSAKLTKNWLRHMSIDRVGGCRTYITRSDGFNNALVGWRRMTEKKREIAARLCKRNLRRKHK